MANGELTDRQLKFCQEYIKDYNATQAAIRAGYSEKTANRAGSRLLSDVDISDYINQLKKEVKAEDIFSVEERIKLLAKLAKDCCQTDVETGKPVHPSGAVAAIDQINKMTGDHAAIKTKNEHTGELQLPVKIEVVGVE